MLDLLECIDEDRSGFISWPEFQHAMADDRIPAMMANLDVQPKDLKQLFAMLDVNGDGRINIVELIEGFNRFRGPAHSLDVHQVLARVNFLIKQQDRLLFAVGDPSSRYYHDSRMSTSTSQQRSTSKQRASATSATSWGSSSYTHMTSRTWKPVIRRRT